MARQYCTVVNVPTASHPIATMLSRSLRTNATTATHAQTHQHVLKSRHSVTRVATSRRTWDDSTAIANPTVRQCSPRLNPCDESLADATRVPRTLISIQFVLPSIYHRRGGLWLEISGTRNPSLVKQRHRGRSGRVKYLFPYHPPFILQCPRIPNTVLCVYVP
jgi:hypothetical protein